jgi:hypothetical protein
MIENWVSIERTVDFVKTVTGSSLGPTCQTLISICESGEVRARWAAHVSRTLPAIHKRDWIGADIDLANFRVVKANGAGMAGVDFSEDDLNTWASRNNAKTATTEIEAAPGQPRRLNKKSRSDYVAAYIKDDVKPTIDGVGLLAIQDGIVGGRDELREEFRRQWGERGNVVGKRGRRKLETRAN